jgi:predicted nucleic-acid-binding protein
VVAVDTKVLVRFLVGDEPVQSAAAVRVFSRGPVWVSRTVLLESAWVLRVSYGLDEARICGAFLKVLGLATVEVEQAEGVLAALELVGQGVDFADALHWSGRPEGVVFLTFDQRFVKCAARAGAVGVELVGAGATD